MWGAVQEIVGLGGVDFNLRVLGILIFHTVKKGEKKNCVCVIFVFSSYFFDKEKNGIGIFVRRKKMKAAEIFFREKCEFSFRRGEFWEGELVHLENL
jgi:hypothetical protein